jgi:hypothetical protein
MEVTPVPGTDAPSLTLAHRIARGAVRADVPVFGTKIAPDATPDSSSPERPTKRAKVKEGKGRDTASGSQVTKEVAEAQSTQASDNWTLDDYTSAIGTLHQVQHLTRADLKNAADLNSEFKALSKTLEDRMGNRMISMTENSDEFVRGWDRLANGNNDLTKQIMHSILMRQGARRSYKPEPS